MEGIEILDVFTNVEIYFNELFLLSLIISIIMVIYGFIKVIPSIVIIGLLGLTIFVILCVNTTKIIETNYYKVLISDETLLSTEFNNKYEIVSKSGNVYTIKDKESKK